MKREIYKLYQDTFDAECVPSNQKSSMALNALLVLMAVFTQPYYLPLDVHIACLDNASQNGKIYWRKYQTDNETVFEPALVDFRKTVAAWEKQKNHSFSELPLASKLSSYFLDLTASEIMPFFENALLRLSTAYLKEDIGRAASCLLLAYCALDQEECPRIGKYGRTSPTGELTKPHLFLKTKAVFSNENIWAVVDHAVMKHNAAFALNTDDLASLTEWLLPYALSINSELTDVNDAIMENATEKIWWTFSMLRKKSFSILSTDEEKLLAYIYEKDNIILEVYSTTAGGLYFFGKDIERKAFIKKILLDTVAAISDFEISHGELVPAILTANESNRLNNLEQRRDHDLEKLRQIQAQVNNADLAATIEHMTNRLSVIYSLIIDNLKKEKLTTRFFDYYLPTTVKLLSNYITAEKTGLVTDNIQALKKHILENAPLMVSVFDKQVDAIFRDEAFDVEAELSVFKGVMSLDGINQEMPTFN